MKHKRIVFAFAVVMSMVTLSGCMDVKDLSDEHADMIAEYSAGVLLRYSEEYERRLITAEQLLKSRKEENPTEVPGSTPAAVTPTPEPLSASPASGDSVSSEGLTGEEGTPGEEGSPGEEEPSEKDNSTEVPLNKLYHVKGLDFAYQSYRFCDRYTEKGNASPIFAEKGNTLFVVSFRVRNISGKKQKVNLMKRNIDYPLTIDGNEYLPRINILKNGGLNYLNTTISKGKTETAVLIYNVSEERKNASEINLVLRDGDNKTSIQLK